MALLVALTVSILGFALLRLTGDPALVLAGEGAGAADIDQVRRLHGLDQPLPVQYARWLVRSLSGDLGESLYFRQPVATLLIQKLPTTVILGLASLAFALSLSILLGVIGALRPNSWLDRLTLAFAVAGQVLPNFFIALLLILVFSVHLRWLPVSGSEGWRHFVLPTVTLGYYVAPPLMRLVRAGMIEALASDYIRAARAKGLPSWLVVGKHALRNALVPVVALAAVQLGFLLGGSIVIETVFALDGLGYLAYQAITRADLPLVQSILMLLSLGYVLLTLAADLINAWLDPRLR